MFFSSECGETKKASKKNLVTVTPKSVTKNSAQKKLAAPPPSPLGCPTPPQVPLEKKKKRKKKGKKKRDYHSKSQPVLYRTNHTLVL
jgi:hypothetical protein